MLALLGLVSTAAAQSSHERIQVKPLKDGKTTVGIKVKLTLRPDTARDGSIVRIGIGRNNWFPFSAAKNNNDHRKAASDIGFGYAVYLQEIQDITTDEPREVELEIPYTSLPGIVPGERIDVYTAWNKPGTANWHVWGINRSDATLVATTPLGKAQPYHKPRIATVRVAGAKGTPPVALTIAPLVSSVMVPIPPPPEPVLTAATPTKLAKARKPRGALAATAHAAPKQPKQPNVKRKPVAKKAAR